jgi:ceramide glucosyltransferase
MIHSITRIIEIIAILGCVSSSVYYMFCLWSVRAFLKATHSVAAVNSIGSLPPVSILKPLKGIDPHIYASFRSHCLQDYPEFEIIFGVSDALDPAVASVEQLKREFPERSIQLVVCSEILGPNVKVSNLEQMVQVAKYQHLIVNDSDIQVESDYLRRIIPPLTDNEVGLVTSLYRGVAAPTPGSQLESLGISTDFCAGVIVARWLESGLHFGLGSTLAFRRKELESLGGFKTIVDFLADDYELGQRIASLGLEVLLSDVVVETNLPAYDFSGFLSHQIRWARGVRDARLGGYVGLVSTFGFLWGLLTVLFSGGARWAWIAFGIVLVLRILVALAVGKAVLKDRQLFAHLWLLPVRDLIAAGIWIVSFWGSTVKWRGDRFELKKGRLIRIA